MTDADSDIILGGSVVIDRDSVYVDRNSPVAFENLDLISWARGYLWAERISV